MYELEGLKHKTNKSTTEYVKSVSNHTSENIYCRMNLSEYFRPKQWVISLNILCFMIMYVTENKGTCEPNIYNKI
jgi:hypothetical protein